MIRSKSKIGALRVNLVLLNTERAPRGLDATSIDTSELVSGVCNLSFWLLRMSLCIAVRLV